MQNCFLEYLLLFFSFLHLIFLFFYFLDVRESFCLPRLIIGNIFGCDETFKLEAVFLSNFVRIFWFVIIYIYCFRTACKEIWLQYFCHCFSFMISQFLSQNMFNFSLVIVLAYSLEFLHVAFRVRFAIDFSFIVFLKFLFLFIFKNYLDFFVFLDQRFDLFE